MPVLGLFIHQVVMIKMDSLTGSLYLMLRGNWRLLLCIWMKFIGLSNHLQVLVQILDVYILWDENMELVCGRLLSDHWAYQSSCLQKLNGAFFLCSKEQRIEVK